GGLQGLFLDRSAGVQLTHGGERKIVLLMLVGLLVDRSKWLEILQRGCALDLRPRRCCNCKHHYQDCDRIALAHGSPLGRLYVEKSDRRQSFPGSTGRCSFHRAVARLWLRPGWINTLERFRALLFQFR